MPEQQSQTAAAMIAFLTAYLKVVPHIGFAGTGKNASVPFSPDQPP